jgi:chemotaxis protein CheX
MAGDGAEHLAPWRDHLDRAAHEVFSTMVGVDCTPAEAGPVAETGAISAVIGLAGALSGSLVLQVGHRAAERLAERLTGGPSEEAMVRDAVGEVCNMVAGAWKSFDPRLSSGCLLSTPTLVAGERYDLFSQRAPLRIERNYHFDEQMFSLSLFLTLSL